MRRNQQLCLAGKRRQCEKHLRACSLNVGQPVIVGQWGVPQVAADARCSQVTAPSVGPGAKATSAVPAHMSCHIPGIAAGGAGGSPLLDLGGRAGLCRPGRSGASGRLACGHAAISIASRDPAA